MVAYTQKLTQICGCFGPSACTRTYPAAEFSLLVYIQLALEPIQASTTWPQVHVVVWCGHTTITLHQNCLTTGFLIP